MAVQIPLFDFLRCFEITNKYFVFGGSSEIMFTHFSLLNVVDILLIACVFHHYYELPIASSLDGCVTKEQTF